MLMKRTENSLISKWWLGVDKSILLSVLALIVFGVFMVWSTATYSARRAGLNEMFYINKMFWYVPLGVVIMFVMSCVRTRWLRYGSLIAFPILTLMMISTMFFSEVKGARRWISLAGGVKIQPSELMKPVFVIVVAMIISRIKDLHNGGSIIDIWKNNKRERNYIVLLCLMFAMFTGILLGIQKDFGMTVTYAVIFISEIFVAGLSWFWISAFGIMALCGGIAVLCFVPHVVARLQTFMSDDSYQLTKSLNAIKESNLFLGGHSNNLKTLIPDVHTDFIFAGIVEELTPIVAALLIAVFYVLIAHILSVTKTRKNGFVRCSVIGITAYIAFQIMINILSTLGILPTKGMTLPFISYGGSSFLSSCIAVGIILSLLQEQNLRR